MSRVPCGRICHQETMDVILHSYARGSFGLVVHDQVVKSSGMLHSNRQLLFISYIEKNSPAERCGILQVGDRILAINGWSSLNGTAEEGNQILRQSTSPLTLVVEFDVIESALPSDGIFDVKLAKRGNNLGIVVKSDMENIKGEPVIISEVRIGSVAYRCGSLHSGDRILAVDNIALDSCTVEEAMRLLQRTSDIVKLRVRKSAPFEQSNQETSQKLVYSIELNRKGGPLGITIASSGEHYEPVLISYLAPGGLAEKTGAIQVGDRILAVNNESVLGMKAADVMHLLQQSTDFVTVKIMRTTSNTTTGPSRSLLQPPNPTQTDRTRLHHQCAPTSDSISDNMEKIGSNTPVQSIDSAVESLDDSTGNATKYQSSAQRYVIDEQMPNTSLNFGLFELIYHTRRRKGKKNSAISWSDQGLWENSTYLNNRKSSSQRCNCQKNEDLEPSNWIEVLEALETVGEAAMLRKLEQCTSGCNLSPAYTQGSPLMTRYHEPSIAQCSDLRLPYGNIYRRQPYSFNSSSAAVGNTSASVVSPCTNLKFSKFGIEPSNYSSFDRMDSLSLSNDSQTSTSLGDIPYHMAPQKPSRYGVNEPPHTLPVLSEPFNVNNLCDISPYSVHDLSTPKTVKSSPPPTTLVLHELSSKTFAPATSGKTHRVRLRKDPRTNSFGFSVSDGIGDNAGVFINEILPGGPADQCGLISPYDKILQINDTSLQYLDCDLALPLLQVDEIELLLYREIYMPKNDARENFRNSLNLNLRDSAV
ncbi:unnamed protein product [Thelazia callipaeda]|uniref:Glutamate receptor-interacting protein 2 n=1 Tax=Thelazia callipaeda TaxID=103827 RepID=A0A0N5DBJ9_THECL|nr:unnamed protein product [Thelazia callipaeda]